MNDRGRRVATSLALCGVLSLGGGCSEEDAPVNPGLTTTSTGGVSATTGVDAGVTATTGADPSATGATDTAGTNAGTTTGIDAGITGADAGTTMTDAGTTGTDSGTTGAEGGSTTSGASGFGATEDTSCCSDGDCLCHGSPPSGLTSDGGPFDTDSFSLPGGTVHFPTDAKPPFAAVAICGGFLNSGPEMDAWGPFYASWGIVTMIVGTLPSDVPSVRAMHLANGVEALEAENEKSSSPLFEKLSGRFGTSGYSMGGGGTILATGDDATLQTSVGLAPWTVGVSASGVTTPTLLLCGTSDTTAGCGMSEGAYEQLESTPKMIVRIPRASHIPDWFGPKGAGGGTSGEYALAFQKVFLERDERWLPLLLSGSLPDTNIQ